MIRILGLLAAALLLSACRAEPQNERALPRLGAILDQTTVSGISSGAYMAGQFQLTNARIVVGAAVIAGGPFGCAESAMAGFWPGYGTPVINLTRALNLCMLGTWGRPDAGLLSRKAQALAERGRIAPLAALARHRVYLFSGTEDRVVRSAVVEAAAAFYEAVGVPTAQIKRVLHVPAGHAFITEKEGLACALTGKPFVVGCNYDQAGDLLAHLYGPLAARSAASTGRLQEFEQAPFTSGLPRHGLAGSGWIYIPTACRSAGCRIHVAFHGCAQSRAQVGDAFIAKAGFQRWADTNRLIILFPQVAVTATNTQACWDWWGYTGPDFLTRDAPQIRAVLAMLEHLAGR